MTDEHLVPELTIEESDAATSHFATIGSVAASWAALELKLDLSMISLGKLPQSTALCLTAQIFGPARKLDAYIAIAHLRGANKQLLGKLEQFAKDTTSLAERRNRIVHDPWLLFTSNTPYRVETTARRRLRHLAIPMTKNAILAIAREITLHTKRFNELHTQIKLSIGA